MKVLIPLLALVLPGWADEGMWLYNQFPTAAVKEKHGFEVAPAFLDHLRLATVRIGGGAGAFVSPHGLIITNYHLVAPACPQVEHPCPGLTASVLTGIEDVTAAAKAGPAAIARIERECGTCSVVPLYSGTRYDLYRYRVYTDLRLVFAPEPQIASFGRERDSITYLRYGMDIAFLRPYENGRPVTPAAYLKWSSEGAKEGELVFAAGNPAATVRATTAAQLTFQRDVALPVTLGRLGPRIKQLTAFAAKDEGAKAAIEPVLAQLLVTYKAAAGKLIGLRNDRLVGRKTYFDSRIRRAVEADAKLGAEAAKVWDEIAAAYKAWAPNEKAYQILQNGPGAPETLPKPVRIALLAAYLDELKSIGEYKGKDTETAAAALADSAEALAKLQHQIEPAAQRLRKKHDDVLGPLAPALEKIAQYRLKLFGAADYPEAAGSPRVMYGVTKAYVDRAGVPAPWAATFGGLFYRRTNQGAYQTPQRWLDRKDSLDLATPLNFVSTCDLGGGDAGAPTVNRHGEFVGIIFDGNLESLPGTYLYSDEKARAVHVAAQGIVEALRHVYSADALVREFRAP